ncbi:hypothetical protein L1987_89003 [Smallanthus sonchifolius]|nr:hypothetical protein L1987_89003 [Smallanthus sonchifolius]
MCSRTLHTSVRPELEFVFNRFLSLVEQTSVQDPHPGLIIASLNFKKPYPGVEETELLSLSTLDMLNQYVYPSISGYEKLDRPELKVTDRYQELLSIYQTELGEIEAITARKIQHSKRKYLEYITALKKNEQGEESIHGL